MVNTNVKYVITIVVSENTEFKTTNGKEMSDKLNLLTVHGGIKPEIHIMHIIHNDTMKIQKHRRISTHHYRPFC
jgi:hypothetical protein